MQSPLSSLSACCLIVLGTAATPSLAQPLAPAPIAQSTSPAAIAQSVDQIAAAVTVRIDSDLSSNGSGVIIGQEGNTYTVLTAEHVVGTPAQYGIVTPDGQRYELTSQNIKAIPGLDLAVIQFSSPKAYKTAVLGNYDFSIEDRPLAFLSGFPGTEDSSVPQREFTVGTVFPTTVTLFAAQNAYSFASGRELVYTSKSRPGMSGGPVFDQLGRVIGIHNASETQLEADSSGLVFPMNIGRSLGVPIRSYLGTGAISKPASFTVQTTPPPRLSSSEITQVLDQVQVTPPEQEIASDWLRYGNHLWRLQRYDEAITATQQALKLDPNLYQAYYVQGLAFNAQAQYQKAIAAFDAALEINPRFYDGWRQKALSLSDLKQYEAALTAINQAISIQSEDSGLYLIQGDIQRSLEQLDAAKRSYSQSLTLKPSAFGYLQRGIVSAGQEDAAAAKADFNRAIELQPQDYLAYVARGLMESAYGTPEMAIADFSRAQSLIPPRSPYLSLILTSKGLGYIATGQYDQAITAQTDAIDRFVSEESPASVLTQSYLLRSLAYARSAKLPLAIADLNVLVQRQPKTASLFRTRGDYYFQSQDPQRAILDFNQAIALEENNASAYQSRGLAYQALQQDAAAKQDFSRAVALLTTQINQHPNQLSAAPLYIGRAQANMGLRNLNAAQQDILKAEKLFTSRGIKSGVLFETIQKLKRIFQQLS